MSEIFIKYQFFIICFFDALNLNVVQCLTHEVYFILINIVE